MPASRTGRVARPGRIVSWGIVAGLALILTSGFATASPAAAPTSVPGGAGCGGSTVPTSYTGAVGIEGGPLPATARASLTIDFEYSIESLLLDRANGTVVSADCSSENGTAVTNATGTFAFQANAPGNRCPPLGGQGYCVEYVGPYGPVSVTPKDTTPSGYALEVNRSATRFSVSYVALLGGVAVAPATGGRAVSVGAPKSFVAEALTGAGGPSPLAVSWNWTLSGTPWSFVGASDGASATVRASAASANGSLEATATAPFGSSPWSVSAPPMPLLGLATRITGLTAGRTTFDLGSPDPIAIAGTGAAGYPYSATLAPGEGGPRVTAPCTSTASTPSNVSIECATNLTYSGVGDPNATVVLSNGFSNASGALPTFDVRPPPAVVVTPAGPVAYAGAALAVEVAVAPGTGIAPFREACLAGASSPAECSRTGGPNWTFTISFPAPGNASLRAWVVDGDGTNRTASGGVEIVAPLGLAPLAVTGNATVGVPLELATSLLGGDLPARAWWNSSDLSGPIASEPIGSDGPVSVTFVPTAAGATRLSVTVVDGLGTVVEEAVRVAVAPAPSDEIAPAAAPGPGDVIAGAPTSVSWQAYSPSGLPNRVFSAPAELLVERAGSGAAFPASVNASGTRPLEPLGAATFEVPADAWADGGLNLTITPAASGPVVVELVGTGLPTPVAPVHLYVEPDLDHLVLFDPTVYEAGSRANATFWHVSDRFGDAAVGGYLVVQTRAGGGASVDLVPVLPVGTNGSGAWVNYSVPAGIEATVRVYDPAGDLLLGPIAIRPPVPGASPDPAFLTLAAAVPIGVAVAGASAVLGRRRAAPDDLDLSDDAAALERLAAGRAGVVERVRRSGRLDLASLETAWAPDPAPPDLADWVASLVADGTLGAELGEDGVARFAIAAPAVGPPRVTIDVAAFDRGLARRSSALAEEAEERPGP